MGTFVISENPDEMLQKVAFHQSLHCLQRQKTNKTEIRYSLISVYMV